MTNKGTPLVELRDISISFGGIKAVDRVSVDLYPGEVVGLLGHNGAGKSTLIKCLSGAYQADSGEVWINGQKVEITNPRDARAHNVETIYQTLALADNLNAASNLFLGRELVTKAGFVDDAQMEAETRKIMARLNPNFRKFNVPVSALSGGQRQSVAIARAVYFNAKILIMDEPTAALGPQETQMVAELIQELKRQGLGIFLIEHDIHAVMDLCDRASVMKNGQLVGTVKVDEVTDDDILGMIILGKPPCKQGRVMYIGLDLGTSGLKGVLIDEDQRVLAEAVAPLTVSRPQEGWSEQSPANWIAAAETVMDQLATHGLSAVRGIGLSGHMHGATLLDAADEVLRPCILWNDTRSHEEAAELDDDPQFRRVTGNIVFPGFTAPKLLWVQAHEPRLWERLAKVLLPKDYLRLWLTGEHVAEMSDAAGTSWLDTGKRDWSDELLTATGLSRGHMPRLVEGSDVSGALRGALAARWGLPADVVVAGGGGDNAASAVGVGVVRAGEAFVSLGTSGVLFAANDGYQPAPETAVHTFCHALPGAWHQMGVILAATDALNWYAGLVGQDAAGLTRGMGPLQAPGKTLFLPYLGGERTPLNDAAIRGAFLGLEHATDRAAGTRAVLEGVTFAFRDSRDALAATGTRLEQLIAVGGGSRSDYWLQAIATALNLPVSLPAAGDFGGAFGAARLAMMAATGAGAEIATLPPIARTFEPDPSLTAAFDAGHARYRAAQSAIKDLT